MARTTALLLSALNLLVACGGASKGAGGSGGTSTSTSASASTSTSTSTSGAGGGAQTFTFQPTAIAPGSPDLTNPLRGQYLWLGTNAYPTGWVDVDSYQRWNWAQIEPTHGAYAWSVIDAEIAAAKARHGRFGLRVMPLCQGCADHMYMGAMTSIPDDLAAVVNPLIGSAPGETDEYVLPDWNSATYLARLKELLDAIGTRYADEPTLAWVDVSSYGNWGEFHVYPFNQPGGAYDGATQQPITDANARLIVQMNAAAFPGKLLVLNSEQPAALEEAVTTTSPPIGLRVDCLGSDQLAGGQAAIMAAAGASDRWRTAPFITEWCQENLGTSGADLFVQGEQQVRDFHISMLSSGNFTAKPMPGMEATAFTAANVEAGYRLRVASMAITVDAAKPGVLGVRATWADDNVAPTYLAWKVALHLTAATGGSGVDVPLAVDLRKVMPDANLPEDESATVATLPSGSYEVALRVDDAQGISAPMMLALTGRAADGSYPLGSIVVP
jgi:hypothetical protein